MISEEEKRAAVERVHRGERLKDVARDIGVTPQSVANWRYKFKTMEEPKLLADGTIPGPIESIVHDDLPIRTLDRVKIRSQFPADTILEFLWDEFAPSHWRQQITFTRAEPPHVVLAKLAHLMDEIRSRVHG